MNDYKHYKEISTKEEYFNSWDKNLVEQLNDELKDEVYNRYVVKCKVFTRDNFHCINENCKTPESPLTLHHIKFQKNGGQDKIKNCATICDSCHKSYHKGKEPLTFNSMTYKIHKDERVNWKELCAKGKEIRKSNTEYHGYRITWELVELLLRFLERRYDEFDMDD